MLLDTNINIYACKPGGEWLLTWTNDPETAIASVTRIESLGFAGISPEEHDAIRGFLATSLNYALDDEIIEKAISLRQQMKMSLGDAIIAATALEYDLPLVTRNEDDFKNITGLKVINPFTIQ